MEMICILRLEAFQIQAIPCLLFYKDRSMFVVLKTKNEENDTCTYMQYPKYLRMSESIGFKKNAIGTRRSNLQLPFYCEIDTFGHILGYYIGL